MKNLSMRTGGGDMVGLLKEGLYVICHSCHMMISTTELRGGFLNPIGDLLRCRDAIWEVKPDSLQLRMRVLQGGRE